MNKLTESIKKHYAKKSKLYIISDIVFYLFVILLIIPSTRTTVVTFVKKITLTAPLKVNVPEHSKLSDNDYLWQLQSSNGTTVSMEQFRGKLIFLNFWATWCAPCRAEMQSIQELYDEYGNKIVFILASRENQETINNFLESTNYDFPVYSQKMAEPEIFQSRSIPTSFLISPEGEIILKKKGATKWDSKKIKDIIDSHLNP